MIGGPVLQLELLLGARRGRQHVFRWIYAGWLLLQFLAFYADFAASQVLPVRDRTLAATAAGSFLRLLLNQQLILLILAAPAMAAGAISDEKETGTLQYLFSAGLTSAEIIAGKLLGRIVQIVNIFLAGWPFLFAAATILELPFALTVVMAAQLLAAVAALAGASILASVWARTTRDAVLQFYAAASPLLLAVWFVPPLLPPGSAVGDTLAAFNPWHVWESYLDGGGLAAVGARLALHVALWTGVAAVCLALAIWRLRPAYLRQLEGAGKAKPGAAGRFSSRWRPEVGDAPIRWKERHVVGLAPLPALRVVPGWLACLLIAAAAVGLVGSAASDTAGTGPGAGGKVAEGLSLLGLGAVLVYSLIVGIRCSGAITAEREKHTWEALLLTPISTRDLVRDKLWGVLGATYPYLAAYLVPALAVCAALPLVAVEPAWPLTAVVLTGVVTWLAMFYVGAAGLWCSARAKGSWRALLGLLGWAYFGGFCLYLLLSPVLLGVWLVIVVALYLIEANLYGTTTAGSAFARGGVGPFLLAVAATLVVMFLYTSWAFLRNAEKRVADYERTRHWRREARYPAARAGRRAD
jgi:ABC-type transport system involved in multi-copper enzyme maturation permease subunit